MQTENPRDPKPGSMAAIAKGCTCPVIDNHYGDGFPMDGIPTWQVLLGCPIHNPPKARDDA